MAVKEGDFIRLEYTGKIKDTGAVFDTTNEETAKEEGILIENKNYGPIPIIVSAGHLLKGLDDALLGMEEGEKKIIELTPDEGFGVRKPELIQLIPLREFRKQNINPQVGMNITLEGHTGKIQSISGGRVRVDFNHELAGKNLEYNIELKEVIEDDEGKVKSMIELHYPSPNLDLDKTKIKIKDGKVVIFMDEITKFDRKPYVDITFARFRIAKDIWENIEGIDKVEFADVFEKKETEEATEQTEEVLEDKVEEEEEE